MKILSVGEFDPCCVSLGHRKVLRGAGIDYRMLVAKVYQDRGNAVDWVWGVHGDPQELMDFAQGADVLQFYPSIGQAWSWRGGAVPLFDADTEPWPQVGAWPRTLWTEINPAARRVYYFHGSVNLWQNLADYRRRYEGRACLTSTIDYATLLPARLAPPVIEVEGAAALREDDEPLVVTHAPTDPKICHTEPFLALCRELGIVSQIVQGTPWPQTVELKKRGNVGFDHLRGCFSVNTLENAALGLVPLVGINPEWLPALLELPAPPVLLHSLEGLRQEMTHLRDDIDYTRNVQQAAAYWFHQRWQPAVRRRLVRLYEGL